MYVKKKKREKKNYKSRVTSPGLKLKIPSFIKTVQFSCYFSRSRCIQKTSIQLCFGKLES